MCGRFSLIDGSKEVLENRFGVKRFTAEFETAHSAPKPLYNAGPSFMLPVIVDAYEGEEKVAIMSRWGFERSFGKSTVHPMVNARLDTIRERPTFRDAYAHRHCLVPANSFFEWRREKGITQPYRLYSTELEMFAMAGIWEPAARAGHPPTFCIITTESNQMMSKIHDRMPIILEKESEHIWLSNHDAELPFPAQYPSEKLAMYPVTTKVNKVAFNESAALEPIPEPGLGI